MKNYDVKRVLIMNHAPTVKPDRKQTI